MLSKYVIVAFLACLDYTIGYCDYNAEYKTSMCSSLKSVTESGTSDWGVLKIKNYGNVTNLEVLRQMHLRRTPNLSILSVHGLINGIDKNALRHLKNLNNVELFDNRFSTLPEMVFKNLPLRNVYIINCRMQKLNPGTFTGSETLRSVFIRNNTIKNIPVDVFGESIEELYIENNGIETIEPYAFVNMAKLSKFSLSGNKLKTFEILNMLGSSSMNVEKLWLNKNMLTRINKNHFRSLPKLKYLFLESNQIDTIEDGAFNGLSKLIGLDLSNNLLKTISENVFPETGLENLELFFIHNNRMTFITDILTRAENLKYVNIFGNPLQCECELQIKKYLGTRNITQVCASNYEGRPVCIVSRFPEEKKKCIKDVEATAYLSKDYIDLTKDYADWKEKCEFLEGYENIAWSINYIGNRNKNRNK